MLNNEERAILVRIADQTDTIPELISRVGAVESAVKSAHHRIDELDSLSQSQCTEHRDACDQRRRAEHTVTVAAIQARAQVKSSLLKLLGGFALLVAGAIVAALVNGWVG